MYSSFSKWVMFARFCNTLDTNSKALQALMDGSSTNGDNKNQVGHKSFGGASTFRQPMIKWCDDAGAQESQEKEEPHHN